ncbi:MAG: segregation/condensation protein [Frankiales bacterium]|nr:segregation/condensation protein [Frankiales bacterium]
MSDEHFDEHFDEHAPPPSAEPEGTGMASGDTPARVLGDVTSVPAVANEAFRVRLDVFEGPFDLLLGLISKHQLDVTEVALSKVTDDFIAHIRALGASWDLGQATEFLVVAATLLDLKAARLLPGAEVEDEEDLALLEARDLLFARLLQYRAYKQAAGHLGGLLADEARRYPRQVALEPRYAGLLPEVLLGLGVAEFAAMAAKALTPRPHELVAVDHAHGGTVSVREQTALLHERLRRSGSASFRHLTADCAGTLEVVARFLGLLELYREGLVAFEQAEALSELHIRWTGPTGEASEDDEPLAASAAGAEWDDPVVVLPDARPVTGPESGPEPGTGPGPDHGRADPQAPDTVVLPDRPAAGTAADPPADAAPEDEEDHAP